MNGLRTTTFVAAAVGALAAAPAQAQECNVDLGRPSQLKNASNALGRVALPVGDDAEKRKQLRSAVEVLTEQGDRIDNPVGRNMLLGQALATWVQQPGAAYVMKRGDVGYKDNAEATIDLVAAADSAFTAVETAQPECAVTVEPYRQQVWIKLVNEAANAANAKQIDSAEASAKRAVEIYEKGPHAYNVLASIAAQRNDLPAAIGYLKQTIEAAGTDTAGTDTSATELRRSSMVSLAALTQQQAQAATGAEQQALNKEAVALYQQYLTEVPNDPEVQSALARALSAAGDTAAAASLYTQMTADPAKYTDMQLFEAGANAANASRREDAIKLFEAGLQKNPHYRDALYNLAVTHLALENGEAMVPVVKRLVEVDPGNPDNWRLYAAAYQLQGQKATGAAKRAATDSVLTYVKRSESVPGRVTVNRFGFDGTQQVMGGTVENLTDKPRSYALDFEFLDQSGNVVASETVNVGPVEPKASQPFTLDVATPGIIAYRYAPLD